MGNDCTAVLLVVSSAGCLVISESLNIVGSLTVMISDQ